MRTLFEISFEVCNKVGGIYTVVSSKAALMKQLFDDYILIGPYFAQKAESEFVSQAVPANMQKSFDELAQEGIIAHYGKWGIGGEPHVILLEYQSQFDQVNEWKRIFWDNFQIDSLNANYDFDEPIAFSLAAGKLIEKLQYENTHVHAHEWMTGFVNLFLRVRNVQAHTVFTTHATMLGRAISGSGEDLYSKLEHMDPYVEARNHGVMEKFTAERACAHHSTVFTTVSEITGIEAEHILGRKPDVLLLNGLDSTQFPVFEELGAIKQHAKNRIHEFLMYYFYPYHSFDLEKTMTCFISGRHEVHNKGIDTTIQALSAVNKKLQEENSDKTLVCFIWVPYQTYGVKEEVLENKVEFRRIKNHISHANDHVQKQLLHTLLQKNLGEKDDYELPQSFVQRANQLLKTFDRDETTAPLTSHKLGDENANEIIRLCHMNNLYNRKEDRVKIVYYPVYLDSVDTLLNMNYYTATAGCDLGLFCSYYEPWGYTPLEGAAVGVPVVTTDLAGYGRFMKGKEGIIVLERLGKSPEKVLEEYTAIIFSHLHTSKYEQSRLKMLTKLYSLDADWRILISNYQKAHEER